MTTAKPALTWILGISFLSALASPARALEIQMPIQFVGQQPNAPDQFTLLLLEHFDLRGNLRYASVNIENTGQAELFATNLYFYGLGSGQIGSTLQLGTFAYGDQSSQFWGNSRFPADAPASISDVFQPTIKYQVLSGPGIAPGYFFEWLFDPGFSIIDRFENGALKVAVETTGGEFTYIAAAGVPDGGSDLVLLGVSFVIMLWFKRRLPCS